MDYNTEKLDEDVLALLLFFIYVLNQEICFNSAVKKSWISNHP